MSDYKIQFTRESVLERFRQIRGLEDKLRNHTLSILEHDLYGELSDAKSNAAQFCHEDEFFGKNPSIHQKAYAQNLSSLGMVLTHNLKDLIDLCCEEDSESVRDDMRTAARNLVYEFSVLSKYLPATKTILELGPVSEKRLGLLEKADISYSLVFYTFNLEFAKDFCRTRYNLVEDIRNFYGSQFSERIRTMNKPTRNISIETKVDYFKNAVFPLINNIQHHAFNPENDVYGRLKDQQKSFRPDFKIINEANENKKEITISVVDNGFGIKPEMQSRLFQKGASTKTDTTIEHGIGLWAVKKFVENNGGRIWFETELGKGTKFRFTIPYREKHHSMYRQ